jgi:hypothetical protein
MRKEDVYLDLGDISVAGTSETLSIGLSASGVVVRVVNR